MPISPAPAVVGAASATREQRERSVKKRDDESGAVMVEAAIIFPLLMLLLFGIVEFGILFKNVQTVYSATRSGARTASAEPRQASYATDVASAVTTGLGSVPTKEWREL